MVCTGTLEAVKGGNGLSEVREASPGDERSIGLYKAESKTRPVLMVMPPSARHYESQFRDEETGSQNIDGTCQTWITKPLTDRTQSWV